MLLSEREDGRIALLQKQSLGAALRFLGADGQAVNSVEITLEDEFHLAVHAVGGGYYVTIGDNGCRLSPEGDVSWCVENAIDTDYFWGATPQFIVATSNDQYVHFAYGETDDDLPQSVTGMLVLDGQGELVLDWNIYRIFTGTITSLNIDDGGFYLAGNHLTRFDSNQNDLWRKHPMSIYDLVHTDGGIAAVGNRPNQSIRFGIINLDGELQFAFEFKAGETSSARAVETVGDQRHVVGGNSDGTRGLLAFIAQPQS